MRISANPKHPDYSPQAVNAKVFLNGVELERCCTFADEEKGEAVCYILDEDGYPMIGADKELVTEIRRGIVEIKLPQ